MNKRVKDIYITVLGRYFYTPDDEIEKTTSTGLTGKALKVHNAKKLLKELLNEY